MELLQHERTLNELDHARLSRLVPEGHPGGLLADAGPAALRAALDGAELVPPRGVPPDVITMYSRVQVAEPATGRRLALTLCYPQDAEPAEGFVSVMSPVGAALLGLRVGARARWRTPAGEELHADVLALLFQPEASGDFAL